MRKKPKNICFIVLSCGKLSDSQKEELAEVLTTLKKLNYWKIEKVTILEDNT